jgi:hypothetical protein
MNHPTSEQIAKASRILSRSGFTLEEVEAAFSRIPPPTDEEARLLAMRLRRKPLWERVAIWTLDRLTDAVDAFTRWISR